VNDALGVLGIWATFQEYAIDACDDSGAGEHHRILGGGETGSGPNAISLSRRGGRISAGHRGIQQTAAVGSLAKVVQAAVLIASVGVVRAGLAHAGQVHAAFRPAHSARHYH
jgi:hypothetical protein